MNDKNDKTAPLFASRIEPVVVLPLAVARIIRSVFIPRNPNKLRGAHPDTVAAASACIAAIEDAERKHNDDLLQEKL